MIVTATEFKTNFGKYIGLIQNEDIYITKNGKTIARVSNPNISAVDSITGIFEGYISDEYDMKDIRKERLMLHEADD